MSLPAATPAESRQALAAGIGSYIFWGGMPAIFLVMGHVGAGPWEILGQRTLWALPCALILVVWARQGEEVRRVLATPRIMVWLVVSSIMIAINWTTFVWAVSRGQTLETSLGYYINPLLNMAVGALFFRERIHTLGLLAIGLAVAGVVLQAFALHGVPVVALVLAVSFGAYGIIRRPASSSSACSWSFQAPPMTSGC